jgi:predicted molibdopterin-dependent oxidoreductase YjgC
VTWEPCRMYTRATRKLTMKFCQPKKFRKAWETELSPRPGLTHTEIVGAISRGEIRALYQVGENPVMSEADSGHIMKALEKLEFFVVQDIFMTRTAEYADVILPAASFAEKEGTFTNTERRVQKSGRQLPLRGRHGPTGRSFAIWPQGWERPVLTYGRPGR